jgi:Rieske Fe-S protein
MSAHDDCEGCGLGPDRRQFLRECAGFGLGFIVLPIRASSVPGVPAGQVRYPVPAADGAFIDRENDVILVRWKGAIYAFARSCPHQNTALNWLERDARFQCPKHKSKYEPDGTFISGRATRSMDRFSLRIEGPEAVVDLYALHRQDKNPAEWAAAVARL